MLSRSFLIFLKLVNTDSCSYRCDTVFCGVRVTLEVAGKRIDFPTRCSRYSLGVSLAVSLGVLSGMSFLKTYELTSDTTVRLTLTRSPLVKLPL